VLEATAGFRTCGMLRALGPPRLITVVRRLRMGDAESRMLAYIKLRHEEGALAVPASEILGAIIPADQPELLDLPAYRYGLDRLLRRRVINAVDDHAGVTHYFIGNHPSAELLKSLGL